MKFYLEKGKVNEVKAAQDATGEIMFLITLTESQLNDLQCEKTVGIIEKKNKR